MSNVRPQKPHAPEVFSAGPFNASSGLCQRSETPEPERVLGASDTGHRDCHERSFIVRSWRSCVRQHLLPKRHDAFNHLPTGWNGRAQRRKATGPVAGWRYVRKRPRSPKLRSDLQFRGSPSAQVHDKRVSSTNGVFARVKQKRVGHMRSNPSIERARANGWPPGPVWRCAVRFCQRGPGVLPLSPA